MRLLRRIYLILRKELSINGMKWQGKKIETNNPFEDPHEVEAYKMEKILFQKCVDLKLV